MTLDDAKVGKSYIIKSFDLEMKIKRRLESLGLTKGTTIKVLNRNRGGAVIFMVRGTRLAIGNEVAKSIQMVEE